MTYYGAGEGSNEIWFWIGGLIIVAIIITVLVVVGRSNDKSITKIKDDKETKQYEEF
jgi:hypothetical protein